MSEHCKRMSKRTNEWPSGQYSTHSFLSHTNEKYILAHTFSHNNRKQRRFRATTTPGFNRLWRRCISTPLSAPIPLQRRRLQSHLTRRLTAPPEERTHLPKPRSPRYRHTPNSRKCHMGNDSSGNRTGGIEGTRGKSWSNCDCLLSLLFLHFLHFVFY